MMVCSNDFSRDEPLKQLLLTLEKLTPHCTGGTGGLTVLQLSHSGVVLCPLFVLNSGFAVI